MKLLSLNIAHNLYYLPVLYKYLYLTKGKILLVQTKLDDGVIVN